MFALWQPDYGDRARRCARDGMNAGEIARELGVPRSTVRGWLSGTSRPDGVDRRRIPRPEFDTLPGASYAYLLGVYPGDGYIAELERTCALRVFCDSRYPRIIREITGAILPAYSVAVKKDPVQNVTRLITNYRWWPVLFPQHGPGRKHEREISLESWQREITERHPESLIRGLIHSDGCRVVATIRKGKKRYRYSRYYFANRSADIKEIFCDHLDLLEISWTRSSQKDIQVARREAVEALDGFVGRKR